MRNINLETIRILLRFLRTREYLVFHCLLAAGYIIFERAGLFRMEPALFREIFHSIPFRIISLSLALNAILNLIYFVRERDEARIGNVLFFLSLLLFTAGLWVSYYTRFEGKLLLAEGESLGGFLTQYDMASLYMPKIRKMDMALIPQVGITVLDIHPVASGDKKRLSKVEARILYAGRTTRGVRQGRLSSAWPKISDWSMITITDFGYAPRYLLSGLDGSRLESERLFMRLYPPGNEASFEAMFLGYVFYIRCYPDYVDRSGVPDTLSLEPKNPVYNLRIVRNKDIVYNGLIKPNDRLRFDNTVISLPEVKMWIEISVVRDPGLPIIATGILSLIASTLYMIIRRRENTG